MPSPQPKHFTDHPYAPFLHDIEKPARYVGGEWGQVFKSWDDTAIRVCLAFPDIYDIGMSHLGTRILYRELNAPDDMLCERAFVPWTDMEEALRARGLPILSLENAKPLRDFHVVGISLQHELVYTNVLTLLDLGGIPLRSDARSDGDPLVLGGGSVASHPDPVAPFFDAFVLGDGESKAVEVARRWVEDLREGVPRPQRLRNLATLGGVYVPSLYAYRFDEVSRRDVVERALCSEAPLPVVRAFVDNLDDFPFPEKFPSGGPEAVFDRLSVEIARGCSQGCRFCQAGMIFRPERERRPADVVGSIRESLAYNGQDEISLTSLSPADYSAIAPLVRAVTDEPELANVALNVSSLRAYGVDDATLDEIRRVRVSNLTFAPEAGTQRLREVVNKNVTEEQLLTTVGRVVRRGWERVKLYFMIGLPTETLEDVEGIVELTSKARGAARGARENKGRSVQVTASASTFVPKPHTPFQWAPMVDLAAVKEKHRQLVVRSRERKVDMKMHEPHGSVLEGVLSRGDRRLADVIEEAWRAGSRFDAWDGYVKWDVWLEAMGRRGLEVADYLSEMPVDGALPWSHLHMGVDFDFLRKEWEKALRPRATLPCLRPAEGRTTDSSKLVCYQCGVECDLEKAAERRESMQRWVPPVQEKASAPSVATETSRYRLRYEKLGRACLLGHLDMVREVPRILRRAGTPMQYSQGFHPKPVMAFGPALSLGVPSFEEYVDIKTSRAVSIEGWLDRINEVCPEGIRFLEVAEVVSNAPPVVNLLCEAEVAIGFDREAVASRGGEDGLLQRVEALLSSETLLVVRRNKSRERSVDLRPFILDLRMGEAPDGERMAEAGVPGSWVMLRLRHGISAQGTVRLDEMAKILGGEEPLSYRAVRLSLRGAQGVSVMG
jgi:radical SAM family uncharacterized protein/radical SAM-linked protein